MKILRDCFSFEKAEFKMDKRMKEAASFQTNLPLLILIA